MYRQIISKSLIFLFFILFISLNTFGIVEKLSIEEKVKRANAIVLGTVEHKQSQWEEVNGGRRIFTYVYIGVEQYIKGVGGGQVEIKVPGGKVGEITEWVSDTPHFTPGEKVILFLKPEYFQIVGWQQGKYTVKDKKVVGLGVEASKFINMVRKINEESYFGPDDVLPTQINWSGENFKSKETPDIGEPFKEVISKEFLKSAFIKIKDREKKEISGVPPFVSSVDMRTRASWTTIMEEDFEGAFPSGSWSVSGNPTWDDDDYKPHSGSWSAWCARGGSSGLDPASSNYLNNMNAWIIYGPFDLSDAVNAELLFYYWNESEAGFDYFKWYASPNGTNWYGYGVSGSSGGWQYVNLDLTDVFSIGNLCGDSSVWIAFKFDSDSSVNQKGAFVDDIILQKAKDTNLTPYQPSGWADKIVVSNHQGDNDDDSPLYSTDTLYIDWAVINNGAVATEEKFYTRLYVDEVLEATWYTDPPLGSSNYAYVSDYSLGSLSAGSHTVKIVTDYDDRILETNENDNEYQRTINIEVAANAPQISSMSPAIASAGTNATVTINGLNFGATQGSSKVEFFYKSGQPKIEAPIISWSDAQIQCIVPVDTVNGYAASSSSGPVTVTTDNGTSNGYIFKVTFGFGEVEWPDTHPWIPYEINENTSDCTGESSAVIAGANEWNNSCARFSFVYDGPTSATDYSYNGHNEIMWGSTGGSLTTTVYWYSGSNILECDIVYNDSYTWCTDGSAGEYDIQNIATHELGHWLNLRDIYGDIGDGAYDTAKTMYGFGAAGEIKKRTLHADEIVGIRWIYGTGGDSWDPTDDTGSGGTTLTPTDGTWQSHGRHTLTACDQDDWLRIYMDTNYSYYFKSLCDFSANSTGHGDVIAYLYSDSSGTNQVGENDDSGGNYQFEFSYNPSTSGYYYLEVNTSTSGNFWSGYIDYKKELEGTPPLITTHPQSQTINYNTAANLSVTATGTGPLSYQWYQGSSGDTSTPVGTNSSSYTTPNLTATTSYWVRVSNAFGTDDSNTATIIVNPPSVPETNIRVGDSDIPDGGSYDFGSHSVGTDTDVTFTIENTGTADLILSGSPIITIEGTDADQFSVQQQPTSPISDGGGSATFIIRFSPSLADFKEASISIGNNDTDENPYDITLEGTGVVSTGSLTVTIEPQGAIDAGAQWKRLCTTTWYDSGYTESGIPAGNVVVEFKEIAGWLKSADQIISIPGGDTAVITGTYTQLFGSGIFVDSGQSLGDSWSDDVALGDVDGDGDLDAFVANHGAHKVWMNDGSGTFTDSGQSLGTNYSYNIALGDLDCDGDLDAFVGNWGSNKVWMNDGSGTFTDSGQNLGSSDSVGVALGDLDCDGDLDAFVGNYGAHKVWLNNGSGTFTDSGQSLGDSSCYGMALGDVDGDGDLDAFICNRGPADKVWLNDGNGTFTDSGQSLGIGYSESISVAFGDVDKDGDLDAYVASFSSQADKVWMNDGSGNFTDSGQILGSTGNFGVALGDLDGDGDPDAFVVKWFNHTNSVWLNDGSGVFTDSGQSLGDSYSADLALGDVDGDGDLDAFVANGYNTPANKVWLNSCISPEISEHPQSQTIDYNATANLSVTAFSTSPISYQWYQGDSGDTSNPVGMDSDSYMTPNLTGTTSYWVRVSNACGSTDSDTATISVLPSTFANFSPADMSTDVPLDSDLDWEDSSGATSYDVYLGTTSPPPYAASVSESYYDSGGLGACETYYWKIVAKNDWGDVEGPEWSFTTIIISPEPFSNLAPSNGATDVALDIDLDWENSSGAASYDVYFGESSPPPYLTTVAESFYDPGVLKSNTTYHWYVVAKNSCGDTPGDEWSFTTGKKSWTFMVYLDGDNNLEGAGIDDFLEMASVGSNVQINIVIQFDRIGGYNTSYGDWTTTKRFYITSGMTPTADNALEDLGELNHGDPQTLIDFIDWAKADYAAEKYALILWNHGGGWRESKEKELQAKLERKKRPYYRAVCWDDTDEGDTLYMDEVQGALDVTGSNHLIGFDACLMGMVEVAYEIKDYGEVMVGSEESEPGDGWPYDTILQDLVNNPSWSSSELGQAIVDRYYESYGEDETQSAIDMRELDSLAGSISTFAQSLIDNWNTDVVAVKSAASELMTEIQNVVIHEQHGADWPGANGLAVYFPLTSGDFDSDYESVIDFANDTQWEEFLQEFYNSMAGSWIFQRRAISQQFVYPEHVDLYHFCELLNTETEDYYTRSEISHDYLGGGTGWNFQYDEASRTYTLPFDFPYFGETILAGTTIYVCTNGYVDLNDFNIDYSNSGVELANNKRIAPYWVDLRTNGSAQSGEDVYITENADSLVIRWVAQTYYGAVPVNVELILYDDGRIQFNYAGGNDLSATPYSPTIGISKGDGINCNFAVHNGQKVLTDVDSVVFTPIRPEPPSLPVNPSPAHETTDVSPETDLDWDDCIGATSYDVYLGKSSPAPFVTTVMESMYDPGTLTSGTIYYWKLVAKNDYGETPGDEWQFITCNMPGAFSNLTPSNGSSNVSIDSDLDWADSSGATSYDVYFGTTSPPPHFAETTDSYSDVGSMSAGTTYYWKIAAKNDCGEIHGEEWSFTPVSIPQYNLTISAGTGGTTNPSPGSYAHDAGTNVSVTAIPNSGYHFSGWSGDASGTTETITIIMESDKSITASFASDSPSGGGGGDDGGNGGGGGCFIATAAYGSPLHPHIDILREFRDRYLMTNELGRKFVAMYYKYSPFVAERIAKYKILKVFVRIQLSPLVALGYSMVYFGQINTAFVFVSVFIFPIFLFPYSRKKFRGMIT